MAVAMKMMKNHNPNNISRPFYSRREARQQTRSTCPTAQNEVSDLHDYAGWPKNSAFWNHRRYLLMVRRFVAGRPPGSSTPRRTLAMCLLYIELAAQTEDLKQLSTSDFKAEASTWHALNSNPGNAAGKGCRRQLTNMRLTGFGRFCASTDL